MTNTQTILKRPIRIAVITVSDTRTLETDTSGDLLVERAKSAGFETADRKIVKDDVPELQGAISNWISDPSVDVIISTGGTGLTGRDVTPQAVKPLLDKEIDGFSVIFHLVSYKSVGLSTIQSRAFAGLAKGTIIFCLPGSTGAVKDGWDEIISHQLNKDYRPCNLVDLMPRFQET